MRAGIRATISPEDDRPGSAAVAVISHSLWIRQFAGQPDTVGRSLTIDGRSATVVGIFPPGFDLPFAAEIWVPLQVAIDTLPLQDRLASAYMPSHGCGGWRDRPRQPGDRSGRKGTGR